MAPDLALSLLLRSLLLLLLLGLAPDVAVALAPALAPGLALLLLLLRTSLTQIRFSRAGMMSGGFYSARPRPKRSEVPITRDVLYKRGQG